MAEFRERDFQVVKVFKRAENAGGQNEGIELLKRIRDGYLVIKKTIPWELMEDDGPGYQEMSILLSLDHPNINKALGCSGNQIMLEYCDRGTLGQLIDRFRDAKEYIPEAFIWHSFKEMAIGLAYIHEGYHGYANRPGSRSWDFVVHADLKPDNVFLMQSNSSFYPRIVIGDFGGARRSSDLFAQRQEEREARVFTPGYQPPEKFKFDRRGDVWAMATIVCDLMRSRENRATGRLNPDPDMTTCPYSTELQVCVSEARTADVTVRPLASKVLRDILAAIERLTGAGKLVASHLDKRFLPTRGAFAQPLEFTQSVTTQPSANKGRRAAPAAQDPGNAPKKPPADQRPKATPRASSPPPKTRLGGLFKRIATRQPQSEMPETRDMSVYMDEYVTKRNQTRMEKRRKE